MLHWSPSTGHFYHAAIHGENVPDDAVTITEARHRVLLDGQRVGRKIIAGADGKPTLTAPVRATTTMLRQDAVIDIRVEARRRILAVASIERQSNDNAVFALRALGLDAPGTFDAALARRQRIDAIRAASNALEAKISTWAAAALGRLDVTDPAYWPAEA
ncbi:hypothetical protein SAMN03159340_01467 [Sphingomonas sp. NFR15]|nr:hypothetical protein SAMN03159340_01467 [Sphingomonas sp. NFR15]